MFSMYSDRFCPDDMCSCYRTDIRQSKEETRAQLEGGVVQTHRVDESERRGIPPSLVDIISYSDSLRSEDGQLVCGFCMFCNSLSLRMLRL